MRFLAMPDYLANQSRTNTEVQLANMGGTNDRCDTEIQLRPLKKA